MIGRSSFTVLAATDGSAEGSAAVGVAASFPWPRGARARGVVARGSIPAELPAAAWPVIDEGLERIAGAARRALGRRWPHAEVAVVSRSPVDAILAEARRARARVIVVGARGHGVFSRLLLGSVSRGVVRHAACAVLVVKRRPRAVGRVVVGLDGSAHSRHAVALLAGLEPPASGLATLVRVVEPLRLPSMGLLPGSARSLVAGQVAALQARHVAAARREVEAAARRLRRAGWKARAQVREGLPVPELLAAARGTRADLVVVGARGVGGIERLLLGSVAERLLDRSPVSVLVVR